MLNKYDHLEYIIHNNNPSFFLLVKMMNFFFVSEEPKKTRVEVLEKEMDDLKRKEKRIKRKKERTTANIQTLRGKFAKCGDDYLLETIMNKEDEKSELGSKLQENNQEMKTIEHEVRTLRNRRMVDEKIKNEFGEVTLDDIKEIGQRAMKKSVFLEQATEAQNAVNDAYSDIIEDINETAQEREDSLHEDKLKKMKTQRDRSNREEFQSHTARSSGMNPREMRKMELKQSILGSDIRKSLPEVPVGFF